MSRLTIAGGGFLRLNKRIWSIPVCFAVAALLVISAGAGTYVSASGSQADRFNMSYIYFGNSNTYTSYVDQTGGALDDISPSYFDLNTDGTLKLTSAVSRTFIKQMHERGIKVTPFLSNHWDRAIGVNALANREQLSSQVAAAVMEYELDGVNVDIENVTEKEKDSYTDLVRLIRQKLPPEKSVSVAVAPNPYGIVTGWHGSYDYAKLAQYSDYLMLMTYDEHYQGGAAGPVAGLPFVESSIKAALKSVPADKLLLGIPFYGRIWKQGESYGGYGISNNTVESLIAGYRGKVTYDSSTQSPKATITILNNDVKPQVLGKTLDAGTYDIWYENEESIKSKLALVGKYSLKGTGSWSLGQETKNTWNYYSLWLNSIYFSDIQTSWARQCIIPVVNKGWMIGVSDSKFMPDAPVTRAQAAVILVRALGLDTSAAKQGPLVFSDTGGHWARVEIEAARQAGLVKGTDIDKYEPDQALTREEMAVLLDRILNPDVPADMQAGTAFYDVTTVSSPWSYAAINRIAAAGILQGYPDKGFHPRDSISRGQMAALMERSAPFLSNSVVLAK